MMVRSKCATRILMVAVLGLLVGCGGGSDGGDDGCPASPVGDYDLAVDITVVCASNVLGVWTGDLDFLPPNEIRLAIYVPGTLACCPETLLLRGVESAPSTYLIDDVPDRLVCALQDQYAYDTIGISGATLVTSPTGFTLTGVASVISGAACLGTITIAGTLP